MASTPRQSASRSTVRRVNRAESQDRMAVEVRDLACIGRPARLVWRKRRWRALLHYGSAGTLRAAARRQMSDLSGVE